MLSEFFATTETSELLILALAGVTAVLTVLLVWTGLVERDRMAARAKALSERRTALKAAALGADSKGAITGDKSKGWIRQVAKHLKLSGAKRGSGVRALLMQAGYRSEDAPIVFAFFTAILPIVLAIGAAVFLIFGGVYQAPLPIALAICTGAALVGFMLPRIIVLNAAIRRRTLIQRALPDALDLLVICSEAGLGLDAALQRVVKEIGRSAPEIAEEFGLLSVELSFLNERRDAYIRLGDRTNMDQVRAITNTLIQAEKYGTPVVQALRVISAELRNDRLMKAEEKAARLPAVLTVPMIVFILPCLFIVLIGPAILRTVDALSKMS